MRFFAGVRLLPPEAATRVIDVPDAQRRQQLFDAAVPGAVTVTGWDRILERDYARLALPSRRMVKFAYLYEGRLWVDGGTVRDEQPGGVTLALYVGDTLEQARELYSDSDALNGLLALGSRGWQLRPNFHFGFMAKGLNWTRSRLSVEEYASYWLSRIADLRPWPREDWDAELERLVADGVFSLEDMPQFDADFRNTRRQQAYPRPTIAATRAFESDQGDLAGQLRTSLSEIVSVLGESMPSSSGSPTVVQSPPPAPSQAPAETPSSPATVSASRPRPALTPRERIAERVRHEVWRRDQGRCVDCGSRERLEYDHIIPISRGGSNTARNVELRCESCNRRKGARV